MATPFKKLSQAEFDAIVDQIAHQQARKRQALEYRVHAALLACFGLVDGVKLTVDQSCHISESFAVGNYVKCEQLLNDVNL